MILTSLTMEFNSDSYFNKIVTTGLSLNALLSISADGVNWTTTRGGAANDRGTGIVYAESLNLWVSVEYNGASGASHVYTSTDALTWTEIASPLNQLSGIAWAPDKSLFVAISSRGLDPTIYAPVMTSPDGVNWTPRPFTNLNDAAVWSSITYSEALGRFVMVADSGNDTGQNIAWSDDGINWTFVFLPVADYWRTVTWSREKAIFIAGGGNPGFSSYIATSTNGINWSLRTSPTPTQSINSIAWSSNLEIFVAVGNITNDPANYKQMLYSADGITWTAGQSVVDINMFNVSWIPHLYKFIAFNIYMYSSVDGITWTSSYGTGPAMDVYAAISN